MLSRVIAKNVGDVFFETQCIYAPCEVVYLFLFWYVFLGFFSLFFVYLGTIYIMDNKK